MTRVRRWGAAAVLGGAVLLPLSACTKYGAGNGGSAAGADKAPVDIGSPLYKAEPSTKIPAVSPAPEPIVLPNAVVQNDVRVTVSATVDAKVEMVATPLRPGEQCPPELLVYHPRDKERKEPFRKLRENDIVREGQLIARLDEQLVTLQIRAAERVIPILQERVKATKASEDDFRASYDRLVAAGGSLSEVEKLEKRSTLYRYIESRMQTEQELVKTESELQSGHAQQARYFVFCPINGRIVKLLKSRDEFCRAGDPIMEVQATDRVRVEGKLDAAYRMLVRPGMKVTVEPARPVSPNPVSVAHRLEVTSLAVTAHPGRPLVVSGGMDASALVWDVTGTGQYHRLPHPAGVAVRAVACTGPKAGKQHLVITGGDDGRLRLWDVTNPNPEKLPTQPLLTFDEGHGAAVTAAAFSPDGKFLATAAGRDVVVWDVTARKRLYALPADHKDSVTTVRFTPQCTLVTAARDRSVRVWKLGDKGATSAEVIDHRNGSVDLLGVSADGAKVLFDKDPGRLDVVSLADGRSVGTLQSGGGGARFATLALFNPDDTFIVTAGGDADQRGELTVWESPQPGGRAAERRRLLAPRSAAVTCVAFSPDPEKRFLAVGTADGGVFYYTDTGREDKGKAMTAEVVGVLPADARQLLVRVEMANPSAVGDDLPDRSQATIIISPDGAAPPPEVIRPAAATGAEPGGVVPAGGLVVPPPSAAPTVTLPPARPATGPAIPPAPVPDKK